MTSQKYANIDELESFLKAYPAIESIDAVFPDQSGVLRGKRLTLDHARTLFGGGFQLPGSMLLLSVTGSCLDPGGKGVSDGDPDVPVRPVAGSLKTTPWSPTLRGQVMIQFLDAAEQPNRFEPRQILRQVVERFADLGLHPVVACELEFSLIDRERNEQGAPVRPQSPVAGRRHASTQLMSLAYVDDFGDYVNDVTRTCQKLQIPVTALNAEYGGDQFEINLRHVPDAVLSADHAVQLMQVVQGVATRHNIRASFMAKPYAATAGSGMHWHVSLLDEGGNNVFDDGTEAGTGALQHAAAGVLKTMPEAMAFYAPNINSYRRFKPGLFVPMTRSWGYNNRSVAVRVPAGHARDRRLEYRVPGADANPYLALAALLAGMHHGIQQQLDAPAASNGNACIKRDRGLPLRLHDALRCLRNAKILPDYIGAEYCVVYANCKQLELDAFLDDISTREYSWYLRPDA
ncbi:MAG TPA: glutamine synthetase family protein [Woeseiaceae bacterium]|nr:glutamine synthetase family protein [Woeseiaceae bacterium]